MQDYKPANSKCQRNNEGLCRRLFNYIVNSVIPRHPEFNDHHHKPMMGVPVSEGNGPLPKSKTQSPGSNLSSEINIDFRHTEIEQVKWNNALKKNVNGIDRRHGDQSLQNGPNNEKNINGEFQAPAAKEKVEIKGSAVKAHATGKPKQIGGEMKTTQSGDSRPISSPTSNNRNAIEEFLKSRKEAMRRYYNMDQKEKQ